MTTGQRIKAARQSAGLTQKELGAKMGIAYQTLAQWENDLRKPKMDTLQRLACALNVPAAELMGNDGRIITERMLDEELDRAFFYKLDEHLAGLTMREKDPLYRLTLAQAEEWAKYCKQTRKTPPICLLYTILCEI